MNRLQHRPLAALVLALSLVGVGCGVTAGDDAARVVSGPAPTSLSQAALARAVTATQGARTQKFHVEMTAGTGAHAFTASYDGSVDLDRKQTRIDMTIDGTLGKGWSTSVLGESGGSSLLKPGTKIEVVTDGDDVYLRSSALDSVAKGKPWIEAKGAGDSLHDVLGSTSQGPKEMLSIIEGLAGPLTDVGNETVRGAATKHVRGTIDFAKAMTDPFGGSSGSSGSNDPSGPNGTGGIDEVFGGLPKVPVDVWVDGDGYVRKVVVALDLADMFRSFGGVASDDPNVSNDPTGVDALNLTQTLELFDIGEPVDITVPDPGDVRVMTAKELVKELGH